MSRGKGAAVPEPSADAGVGSGGAGRVSGMIIVGGEERRSRLLVLVGLEILCPSSINGVMIRVGTGTCIADERTSG